MMSKRMIVTLLTAVMVSGTAGLALAAEQKQSMPAPGMQDMGQMPMGHEMMGGGMMDMMKSCQKMMHGGMSGNAMMPHLPPGNEKLEFKMHAEMMQKMGEIAAKYADQIKEAK